MLFVVCACDRRPRDAVSDASTTAATITDTTDDAAARAPIPPIAPIDESPRAEAVDAGAVAEGAAPDAGATANAEPGLPAWVPERGRLTIVQAPDLRANLGMPELRRVVANDAGIVAPSPAVAPPPPAPPAPTAPPPSPPPPTPNRPSAADPHPWAGTQR